jgi:hypothetical protein
LVKKQTILTKNDKIWTRYGKYGLKGKIWKILIDNFLMASYMMLKICFLDVSEHIEASKKNVNPYKSGLKSYVIHL